MRLGGRGRYPNFKARMRQWLTKLCLTTGFVQKDFYKSNSDDVLAYPCSDINSTTRISVLWYANLWFMDTSQGTVHGRTTQCCSINDTHVTPCSLTWRRVLLESVFHPANHHRLCKRACPQLPCCTWRGKHYGLLLLRIILTDCNCAVQFHCSCLCRSLNKIHSSRPFHFSFAGKYITVFLKQLYKKSNVWIEKENDWHVTKER